EPLERLEHLAKEPNVEPHPLPAANRDQSGVNPGARLGCARPERLDKLRLELGGNLLINLISTEIGWRVASLTRVGQRGLFHPLPVDQESGLLARPDQLAQDHGP